MPPARPPRLRDTAAALERYTADQLVGLARRLAAELQDRGFAGAGRHVDRMPDGLFARYGLGPQDVARLRERFTAWPVSACPVSAARKPGFWCCAGRDVRCAHSLLLSSRAMGASML